MQEFNISSQIAPPCAGKNLNYNITRTTTTYHVISPILSMGIQCKSFVTDNKNDSSKNTYSVVFYLNEKGLNQQIFEKGFIFETLKEKYFDVAMIQFLW